MSSEALPQVAIIGMSLRFPGAKSPAEFWKNLRDGVETVSFFTSEELQQSGVPLEAIQQPGYVPAKAIVDHVEMFDYQFFGLTPREAELMDPQQRLFLECAWEALENAGYDFQGRDARVGVYAGSGVSTWLLTHVWSRPDVLANTGGLDLRLANGSDFLPTHVSYKLNLRGPSIGIQTACSTGLVAVHTACQALLTVECDMALAGAVAISFPLKSGHVSEEGSIFSPDGHCRPFDINSAGTVNGNGVGIVVLKRLEDALADRDYIHAVIRGSAINNDGSAKAGFTAPGVETQTQVIKDALRMAEVRPETIGYVEAHGSGTPMGDPIEVQALTQAYRAFTAKKNFCFLGSVKSNMGHLDNAAGMASLIKTVEALKHGEIPPTLHFRQANPQLKLEDSPFTVNPQLEQWPPTGTPRRAGVSSLGIGGTNVHVVLEEAPARTSLQEEERWSVLPLSARTPTALNAMATSLAAHLQSNPQISLSDVAYTLAVGRRQFGCRRVIVEETAQRALAALLRGMGEITEEVQQRFTAFLFPGLGDHYPEMAAGLFHTESGFRNRINECAAILQPLLKVNIGEVLFPGLPAASVTAAPSGTDRLRMMLGRKEAQVTGLLARTSVAQPALFAVEYALAGLLADYGVHPAAMIGYSLGEYVAACLAGTFSLQDALRVVAVRAQLIEELPQGAMLAVPLAEEELQEFLGPQMSVSVSTGLALTVIGGPGDVISGLEKTLADRGVAVRRMSTAHAFHSAMMEPVMERFAREVARVPLQAPRIPFLSNVTGDWITAKDATDPHYWARHMRHTVRFGDGLKKLLAQTNHILVEVGPGQALSTLARQYEPHNGSQKIVVPTMKDRYDSIDDALHFQRAVGWLWTAGARVDWAAQAALHPRQRIPLPAYPFERQRCWIEPGSTQHTQPAREAATDPANWFYVPAWRPAPLPQGGKPAIKAERQTWLIFQDEAGIGSRVAESLSRNGDRVITVSVGTRFIASAEDHFAIRPGDSSDYKLLLQHLKDDLPQRIVHLFLAGIGEDSSRDCGFYSLLYLSQALGEHNLPAPVQLEVVSSNVYEVTGSERIQPEKAAALGPVKVIPQEYANIRCRSIDIPPEQDANRATQQLLQELLSGSEPCVAWRGSRRWTRIWSPVSLPQGEKLPPALRPQGTYLITGGLEGTGLVIAEYLSRTAQAQLVLAGPASFPARQKWEEWLQAHDDHDQVSRSIRRIRALEFSGREVLALSIDVTDQAALSSLVEQAVARFGNIHGVVHAAGSPGAGLIQLKTRFQAEAVLAPKIEGTLLLHRITENLPLDFFLLCSSVVSIGGGLGQVDTSAAGAFLDAYAYWRAGEMNRATTVINWSPFQWDTWQVPSLPGETTQSQIQSALQSSAMDEKAMTEALNRVLSASFTQMVVSPHDFNTVLQQTDALTASSLIATLETKSSHSTHQRPQMPTPYQAPRNPTEELIAGLWAEVFGLEKIGIHDNFFDLSGNSLLALQIVTRLRRDLNADVQMNALFEAPTVAGLAARVEKLRGKDHQEDDLEALLNEVELLSVEDAQKHLLDEGGLEQRN